MEETQEEQPQGQPGIHGTHALFELTKNVPTVDTEQTVGEVRALLVKDAEPFDSVDYVYFTDDESKLVGAMGIKKLLHLADSDNAFEHSKKELVTARASTAAEKVALRALAHNIKAVPIVDADNHFLGVMSSDAILHTLHDEAIEDVLRSSGVVDPHVRTFFDASRWHHVTQRLPWLVVGFLGSLAAAAIVSRFDGVIQQSVLLAAFIPTIVYITDAVGAQTDTIFNRFIATRTNPRLGPYLRKELGITISMAFILSLLAGTIVSLMWETEVAMILSLSMIITITVASFIGILLPWTLLKSRRVDPAVASGPFGTSLRDVITLTIYFTVAVVLLGIL